MRIIDAQHHEPPVWLDWDGAGEATGDRVLAELELAAMSAAGVSSVVLNPSGRRWAEAAATRMPDRFAVAANYSRPAIAGAEDIDKSIEAERANPAVVGLRIVINSRSPRWASASDPRGDTGRVAHDLTEGIEFFESGGYAGFLHACERERMPVFVFSPTRLDIVERMAETYPSLPLIVDHLGFSQPPVADPDDPPHRYLPDLVRLAAFPQVHVKLCGLPAFSTAGFPFADVWNVVREVTDAFGAERLMWASDISRIVGRTGFTGRNPYAEEGYPGKHTYAESLGFVLHCDELSDAEKAAILGGTAEKVLGWKAR